MDRARRDPPSLPTMEQIEAERKRIKYQRSYRRALRGTVFALVVVAAVAVLISSLLLPVMQITGSSMAPTLEDGDIIVLVKAGRYERGELCGFTWNNKTLIKRVIAGPGDWVEIDGGGAVYVNGELLEEPYLSETSLGICDIQFPYQVPENSYFVMGDKRDTSVDSRSTLVGCVSEAQIVGRVLLRIYPLKEFTLF